MPSTEFNAFLYAQQQAESYSSGGSIDFFKINDGESKTLRFLNGLVDYVVVKHDACGQTPIDIRKSAVEEARSAGKPVLCPNCGQPLSSNDFLYERPGVIGAEVHSYVSTPQGRRTFMCLSSAENAAQGIVPVNDDGTPKYTCPIDDSPLNKDQKGNSRGHSNQLYGLAVEREIEYVQENKNGRLISRINAIKDVMVTDDNGETHPKIVLIQRGFKSFWSKIYAALASPDFTNSVCDYDWVVTRMGTKFDTSYNITMASQNPVYVDMQQYKQWMPDIVKYLSSMGRPEYFTKYGFKVQGFNSVEKTAPQPAQAPTQTPQYGQSGSQFTPAANTYTAPATAQTTQPYPAPNAAPVATTQVPVGAMPWDQLMGK